MHDAGSDVDVLGGIPHPTAPAVIEKNAALARSGGMSTIADKLAWPGLAAKARTVPTWSFRN